MKKILAIALTVGALCAPSTASAQSLILPGGQSVQLEIGSPLSFVVDYAATHGDNYAGAAASITFNFLGTTNDNAYDFTFVADNTSVAPSTSARLVSFGFDAQNPNSVTLTGVEAGEPFNNYNINFGNFNGMGSVDVCLYSGSNCNGNQGGLGVAASPFTGAFTLNYSGAGLSPIVLNNFRARWQSLGSNTQGSGSGGGMISNVPEPATWAMMLFGFGAVGFAMRRRRSQQPRFVTA